MTGRVYANPDLCTGCELCAAACSVSHFGINNPKLAGITIRQDLFARYELQLICRHCEEPPCVEACIAGTMQTDPQTGRVNNDPAKCVGCLSCLMVCPYDAIIPAKIGGRAIALKCDGCPDQEVPACVTVCPTEALVYR
ncbi:MAG: 4Fe-4S dicluster domain-containing protein [Candidatus Bipolaricaulia bacterium]